MNSLQAGLSYFFANASFYLNTGCPDPKGLGPNLDIHVSVENKQKVDAALQEAAKRAGYALMYESQSDTKNAIYWWQQIFGANFPSYG